MMKAFGIRSDDAKQRVINSLTLKEFAAVVLPDDPKQVAFVFRGQDGYTPYFQARDEREARRHADRINTEAGVTPAMRQAMLIGSMFGWHVPGANPKDWEDSAKPLAQGGL